MIDMETFTHLCAVYLGEDEIRCVLIDLDSGTSLKTVAEGAHVHLIEQFVAWWLVEGDAS